MSQVFTALDSRLGDEYSVIELKSEEAKERVLVDVRYLQEKLGGLKGLEENGPGKVSHFGSFILLQRLISASRIATRNSHPREESPCETHDNLKTSARFFRSRTSPSSRGNRNSSSHYSFSLDFPSHFGIDLRIISRLTRRSLDSSNLSRCATLKLFTSRSFSRTKSITFSRAQSQSRPYPCSSPSESDAKSRHSQKEIPCRETGRTNGS